MNIKRILIYLPLGLILFLVQSFFWVPTYDKQAVGNPDRLVKYIHGSAADAEILNPILSADTTSSSITDLVFDGLIDLDDKLEYRPRLASSWTQYEEAYLVIDPSHAKKNDLKAPSGMDEWGRWIQESLKSNDVWTQNLRSVEMVPGKTVKGQISLSLLDDAGSPLIKDGQPTTQKVEYDLQQPDRIKFTLYRIDQDFFTPVKKLLGEEYFQSFPYEHYIHAVSPSGRKPLASNYAEILPLTEHNPIIVFNLRKGAQFHDGHTFDSGDVLFTYQAIMNPKNVSPRTSDYEPIKSVEPVGPHQVKIVYKRLFSPAINSWFMGILPEHLLNDAALNKEAEERGLESLTIRDSQFNRYPIGTGPFIFKEWQSDELIRVVRNETYWDSPPEYHEYVMRVVPDALTQEMEFYAGAVDNYSVQPHQVARFKTDEKYQSFSSVGYFYSYIGYNERNPLFKSAEVRRALGMAIDVEQIIKYVLYGEGERVTGPYPKITDWYDPSIQPLPYDPEGALKILNGLGWRKNDDGFLEKDGKIFEFNLITNSGNPIRKNILTIAQNSWRKLGIKCNTQLFEWAVFLKDFVNTFKYDALVLGWSMGIDPDLFQIWHSSQAGPKQLNFVGYENPDVDRLIVRIRKEYDKAKQKRMAHELHRQIAKDQPYTFLYVAKSTQLLDKKIVIVERQPDGSEKYTKIYPTKDGRVNYYFNKWKKLGKVPQFAEAG
ncbi:MAG: ABC transporter substrate-binding protein [Nitrospinae bacterium]|jgi:ABC-type transport system substrate-binding protein|nr:ABC transporter substrate-binding protein [Nitrospinota bacterium]MDA1110874.1 ABC transporter substrate-binding protein [Nitrospinota bacterium]